MEPLALEKFEMLIQQTTLDRLVAAGNMTKVDDNTYMVVPYHHETFDDEAGKLEMQVGNECIQALMKLPKPSRLSVVLSLIQTRGLLKDEKVHCGECGNRLSCDFHQKP